VLLILRRVFLQGCNLIFKHEQLEAGWKWTSGGGGFGLQFFARMGVQQLRLCRIQVRSSFSNNKKKRTLAIFFSPNLIFFSVFVLWGTAPQANKYFRKVIIIQEIIVPNIRRACKISDSILTFITLKCFVVKYFSCVCHQIVATTPLLITLSNILLNFIKYKFHILWIILLEII
jgi:hypothetical protein